MDNDIENFSDVISRTINNICLEDVQQSNSVITAWNKVLLRIKSYSNPNEGRNLADHTRVVDFKNGILLIESDHPGWIELLQLHKSFILKGLNMSMPQLKINTLAYKLKGSRGELSDSEKSVYSQSRVKNLLNERIEKEEIRMGLFNKKEPKNTYNKELPPELKSIFDDLKKNMLTNSKK